MDTYIQVELSSEELREMIREEITEAAKVLREDKLVSRPEIAKALGAC